MKQRSSKPQAISVSNPQNEITVSDLTIPEPGMIWAVFAEDGGRSENMYQVLALFTRTEYTQSWHRVTLDGFISGKGRGNLIAVSESKNFLGFKTDREFETAKTRAGKGERR